MSLYETSHLDTGAQTALRWAQTQQHFITELDCLQCFDLLQQFQVGDCYSCGTEKEKK